MKYPYKQKGNGLGRNERNIDNQNIKDIESDIRELLGRINNLVISASTGEIQANDARLDLLNVLHDTLKERLDSDAERVLTKADQSYVETMLATAVSGAPKGFYNTLTALNTAYPQGTDGVFLVLENGHIYIWNDTTWADAGVYQGIEIPNKTVGKTKLTNDVLKQLSETYDSDDIAYAIVDNSNRCVFSIDLNGKTRIFNMDFETNSISETAIEGVANINSEASGVLWGVVDASDRMSELIINTEGKVPSWVLDSWKERMFSNGEPINEDSISCWGDSLTAGAGGNGTTYPNVLASLTGRTVYNMGVGGETSATIACRQGGRVFIVNDFTIPADTTKVKVAGFDKQLTDNFGRSVHPLRQGNGSLNPCYIAGIQGTLSIIQTSSTSTDYEYFFQRTTAGSAKVIDRPTPIITDGQIKRKSDIMVIFIGQNGGFSDDNELINQIKSMVDFNDSPNTEYVVVGVPSGSSAERAARDSAFQQAFGRRFINIREYLSKYGLADAGITPTTQDLDDMSKGMNPTSLRVDSVHLNAAGYTVIGNVIYKRLKELGILGAMV